MAGWAVPRVVRTLAAVAMAWAVVLVASPGAASAAEAPGQELAARVISGVAIDLDGDGAREILAVRAADDDIRLELEAWRERNGSWESLGSTPVLVGIGRGSELQPASMVDDGALLLAADDGELRLPVLATKPVGQADACCLTIFEVMAAPSGGLQLRVAATDLGNADSVSTLDVEGDGRDDLLAAQRVDPTGPAPPFERLTLLRRVDGRFVPEPVVYPEDGGQLAAIGDSDGVPGDEIHFLNLPHSEVTRVSADGGMARTESQSLEDAVMGSVSGAVLAGAADGRLVVLDGDGRLASAAWQRGGRIVPIVRSESTFGTTVFILGEGPGARILAFAGLDSRGGSQLCVRVLDLDLRMSDVLEASPVVEAMAALVTERRVTFEDGTSVMSLPFRPVSGPAGTAGAMIGAGSFVELTPAGALVGRAMRPFAADGSVGLAGSDGAWLAVGMGWTNFGDSIGWLDGGPTTTRLVVHRVTSLLETGSEKPPAVDLAGAAVAPGDERPVLYASPGGYELSVETRPGDRVIAVAGRQTEAVAAEGSSVTVHLQPGADERGRATQTAGVVVLDPDGLAQVAIWNLVILGGPPELEVTAMTRLFAARVAVSGTLADAADVTVDNRPVSITDEGSFAVEVSAPIWGRSVTVAARDPLGREAVELMTIYGVLDLRELPWAWIIGSLTLAVGALLFLRVPRAAPRPEPTADGQGSIEEVIEQRG